MAALPLSIGLGVAFALALRAVRVHRALGAVLAGVFAGAIVGFTLEPPPERAVLESLETSYQQELEALDATGVSESAIDEHRQRHEPAIEEARADLQRALESRRVHPAIGILALVGIALGAIGTRPGHRSPGPLALLSGTVQVLFSVLPAAVLAMWLLPVDREGALLVGLLVGAFHMMTNMPVEWINEPGRHPFVHHASLSGAVVLVAIIAIEPTWWTGGALLAWGAGWGLGRPAWARRWVRPALLFIIVPGVVAWLVAHADQATLDWKITLFILVPLATASEGHALGLWLGMQVFAPDRIRARGLDHAIESQTSGLALSRVLLVALVLMTVQDDVVRTALVGVMVTEAIGLSLPLPGLRGSTT